MKLFILYIDNELASTERGRESYEYCNADYIINNYSGMLLGGTKSAKPNKNIILGVMIPPLELSNMEVTKITKEFMYSIKYYRY